MRKSAPAFSRSTMASFGFCARNRFRSVISPSASTSTPTPSITCLMETTPVGKDRWFYHAKRMVESRQFLDADPTEFELAGFRLQADAPLDADLESLLDHLAVALALRDSADAERDGVEVDRG